MTRRFATVVLLVCLSGSAVAARAECEFEDVERIVAVGDVHGAYDQLVDILQIAGVIDDGQRWTGGRTHLVQLGDVLDRGPDSRKVLDFYRRLEGRARSQGGRVHFLLGNHEAMRLVGDRQYTSPEEYEAFVTRSSRTTKSNFLSTIRETEVREYFAGLPLGAVELILAFGSKETYGSYLRKLNAVVRINGVVFVHGGISPEMASRSCSEINETIQNELSPDQVDKTREEPETTLSLGESGPLWYRGLIEDPEPLITGIDETLEAQNARAMVVGHTPVIDSRILVRFGGKVLAIDTGMEPSYVPDGRPSALEIRDGVFTAIYPDRRKVLVGADGRVVEAAP